MRRHLLISVFFGFCIFTQALAQGAGGYIERKVTDRDVVAAAKFAVGAVKKKEIAGGRILRAASQVVAGTNYRLDLQVIDKSGEEPVKRQARVVVYQSLDDEYELTSWNWKKAE